jgi:hypothetical protein
LVAALLVAGCGKPDSGETARRKVLYYQSAMHPWIKSDKPGRWRPPIPVGSDDLIGGRGTGERLPLR